MNADEVLTVSPAEKRSATRDCAKWLSVVLSNGQKPTKAIIAEAEGWRLHRRCCVTRASAWASIRASPACAEGGSGSSPVDPKMPSSPEMPLLLFGAPSLLPSRSVRRRHGFRLLRRGGSHARDCRRVRDREVACAPFLLAYSNAIAARRTCASAWSIIEAPSMSERRSAMTFRQ